MRKSNPRINITFDDETYEQIKLIADSRNCSMSEVCRLFVQDGLNGDLTKSNIDYVSSIIREQIRIVLQPGIERLAALSAKACMQAGTAAYLSAEALANFVPLEQQRSFEDAYNAARRKAALDIKQRNVDIDTEE